VKRKSGCLRGILAIFVLLVFILGLDYAGNVLDRRRFPWGYEKTGTPTLAGTWVGPLTSGSGKRLGMLIEMRLAPLDHNRRRRGRAFRTQRSSWLIGRVLTCTGPGRPNEYEMDGKPDGDNRNASRFRLSMHPKNDTLITDGLAPSHVQGRWGGKDSIDLLVSLHLRRGQSSISGSDDPDTGRDQPVTLNRGTEAEFTTLCGRLSTDR
jgi:hypothetical protein